MLLRIGLWTAISTTTRLVLAAPKPQLTDPTLTFNGEPETFTSGLPAPTNSATIDSGDACAQLASLAGALEEENPMVPADLAWNCLQAIPFDTTTAEAWVQSLKPYIRWQTTLAYLKNPPEGYPLPPYDVYAAYDEIMANVQDEKYTNQYEFEFAIYRLFQRAHDGHFSYRPNLINNIAGFGRPFALVSVSADGQELPRPYVYSDILLSYNESGFEPSAVVEIDGQNVEAFLESLSLNGPLHDLDALWNYMFLELATVSLGPSGSGPGFFSGGGNGDLFYPNATTTLAFENGTTTTYNNLARLAVSFTNITSAEDLYQRYVNLTSPRRSTTRTPEPNTIPAPGFPEPVIRDAYNLASGYYLEEPDYEDIAVLSLPSFQVLRNGANVSFSFLDKAKNDGKTKLIIDLSANAGGSVAYGFALFVKLFPNLLPYLGTRFRATETFDIIGQTISDWSNGTADLNFTEVEDPSVAALFNGFTPFPYASDVDENYESFPNWPAKFGPHEYNGDNFTSIIRWNFSQSEMRIDAKLITNDTEPMFAPENIVILTDGFCASTCSNFVEHMTSQAGVMTIFVGGRPNSEPAQLIGGTRGSNSYAWNVPLSFAEVTYNLIGRTQSLLQAANLYLNTELGEYLGALGVNPNLPFLRGGTSNSLNVRDNIRRGDEDQIPLQFRKQLADCRLFWTRDMTVDISALWKKVAEVSWGNGTCVAGGIQNDQRRISIPGSVDRKVKKSLSRRTLKQSELDALADGVNIWTNHEVDMSGGGVVLP